MTNSEQMKEIKDASYVKLHWKILTQYQVHKFIWHSHQGTEFEGMINQKAELIIQ